jgi:hypothetical protein
LSTEVIPHADARFYSSIIHHALYIVHKLSNTLRSAEIVSRSTGNKDEATLALLLGSKYVLLQYFLHAKKHTSYIALDDSKSSGCSESPYPRCSGTIK